MKQITPRELADWLADAQRPRPVLLDVREPHEVAYCALPDTVSIPMNTVPLRKDELDPAATTVVICHHGGRSFQVAQYLEQAGFTQIINLAGGMHGWSCEVDPSVPTY